MIDLPCIQNLLRLAADGVALGWHERNGGNLSYRLTPAEQEAAAGFLSAGEWLPLGIALPELAGETFLITAAGSYMRHLSRSPEAGLGLIELDPQGERYRPVWGFHGGGRPTSEMPTHLMGQAVKKRINGPERVIYHAHPANLIALTFALPQDARHLTRELWAMMPECPMVFPEGLGLVPWMRPGTRKIAVASAGLLEKHNAVVWAQHGLFCAGADFDATFGLMETVEKAAEIYVKVLSLGGRRHGPDDRDLERLAAEFSPAGPVKN